MISRLFRPTTSIVIAALVVANLITSVAQAQGPEYTYIGISYEWTDIKYGVSPKGDARYNNGTLEGENIDLSIGILSWLHVKGQAFGYLNGTCKSCNTNDSGGQFDADMEAFKIGIGVNLGMDLIGGTDKVDLVLRGNYIDTTIKNLNIGSVSSVSDDGWSAEAIIRGQVSDRADVHVGYEYHRLSDIRNRDMTVGIKYRVFDGLSLMGRAIVFDNETGFELGLRWQFGNQLFGADSIVH